MPFSVKHVANCFLQRDFEDGKASISPMKLQKLVYCLHGWHLAITERPAINSNFQAWPYGPVEENLYHLFKSFRNNNISSYASSWAGDKQVAYVVSKSGNEEFYDIFDCIIKKYMPFSAIQLSALTHKTGTPWSITRDKGKQKIEDSLIQEHFSNLVSE